MELAQSVTKELSEMHGCDKEEIIQHFNETVMKHSVSKSDENGARNGCVAITLVEAAKHCVPSEKLMDKLSDLDLAQDSR